MVLCNYNMSKGDYIFTAIGTEILKISKKAVRKHLIVGSFLLTMARIVNVNKFRYIKIYLLFIYQIIFFIPSIFITKNF